MVEWSTRQPYKGIDQTILYAVFIGLTKTRDAELIPARRNSTAASVQDDRAGILWPLSVATWAESHRGQQTSVTYWSDDFIPVNRAVDVSSNLAGSTQRLRFMEGARLAF